MSDWRDSILSFGSHRACLNILMNNCRKIGYNADPEALFWSVWHYQEDYQWSIQYNIQWHLIVTDPEFMLACLSDALGRKLTYKPVVQHAFQQYINSCWPPELQGDKWLDHPVAYAWMRALKKRGFSEDEIYKHWTPYTPS